MSKPTQEKSDIESVILGNGDTLEERLEKIDLEEENTVNTDELRERLGL